MSSKRIAETVRERWPAVKHEITHGAGGETPNRRRFIVADSRQIICPHCQVKGSVKTRQVKVKQGISGGKATGAVLTLGVSMLATGLSRKQKMTEAKCGNCGSKWLF